MATEAQSHDCFALGRRPTYLRVIKAGGFREVYSPFLDRYTVTVYGSLIRLGKHLTSFIYA